MIQNKEHLTQQGVTKRGGTFVKQQKLYFNDTIK